MSDRTGLGIFSALENCGNAFGFGFLKHFHYYGVYSLLLGHVHSFISGIVPEFTIFILSHAGRHVNHLGQKIIPEPIPVWRTSGTTYRFIFVEFMLRCTTSGALPAYRKVFKRGARFDISLFVP
jgi:hypothetical protein